MIIIPDMTTFQQVNGLNNILYTKNNTICPNIHVVYQFHTTSQFFIRSR